MPEPKLKTVFQTQGHTRALKDGTLRPRSFAFEFEEISMIVQAFRRMVRGLDFDVSEMAFTTYLCARDHGKRMTALPIMIVRAYHHGIILYNTRVGVRSPKDLEGKKVGVNRGYTVTAGVWVRGALQHEYGVDLNKITWVLSGDEHVAEYQAPSNVILVEPGKKLEDMVTNGEIAATIGVEINHPNVAPLIPYAETVGLAALRDRGYYPINHALVVKDEVLARDTDVAVDIFNAFVEAKHRFLPKLKESRVEDLPKDEQIYRRVMDVIGDPLPYGIEPNRRMLETLIGFADEQKIIRRRPTVEELFPASLRGLAG